ncbi:MAG: enolase C-terminal domain-like protein [Thermoguttaceae bacterium]|jgi:O-succinylbenzoate synthase
MKIDAIDLYLARIPLRRPQKTAMGVLDRLETVIAGMRSGGLVGWGEASPGTAPLGGQWAGGAFACLRDWLAPALVGRQIETGTALQEQLQMFSGNQYAKAALDSAWWDLKARQAEKPLHELLGGKKTSLELGISLDRTETIDELIDSMRKAFAAGFSRIELKMRPGWDIQMINHVRHEFGAETLHVDVEGAMTLAHMETLYRLDDFMLAMVEQPFMADDLVGHAMAQESLRTPICLDESVVSLAHVEMALDLKSCQFINVDFGRVGGLTPAVAIHDACHEHCTPCRLGATSRSAIGARAGLALAAKDNFTYPADWIDSPEMFEFDLADPPLLTRLSDGQPLVAELWSEPGIGVVPDLARLESCSAAKATIA